MELMGIDMKLFASLETELSILAKQAYHIAKETDYATQKWLDNQDVCLILNVSYRTLQYYRGNGNIPFTRIDRKIYYKPEDVEKLLARSLHKK